MSVTGGGRASEYSEFDIQTTKAELEIQGDFAGGGNELDQVLTIEPAGGLQRNEVAELVALYETIYFAQEASPGELENEVLFEYELSTDPNLRVIQGGSELSSSTDLGGTTGLDGNFADTVDPDVLRVNAWGGASMSQDETNGAGAAGINAHDWEIIPYRQVFGTGPVFDRHDNLHYHMHMFADVEALGQGGVMHTYVWDVTEEQ